MDPSYISLIRTILIGLIVGVPLGRALHDDGVGGIEKSTWPVGWAVLAPKPTWHPPLLPPVIPGWSAGHIANASSVGSHFIADEMR